MTTVGSRLRDLRLARNQTPAECGKGIGSNGETWKRWEQEESTPIVRTIQKIAELWRLDDSDLAWLVTGKRRAPET